jgi:2-methylcitrate dehydratase PrpD
MKLTARVVQVLSQSGYEDLPETAIMAAKHRILDTIGVTVPPRSLDENCVRVTEHMLGDGAAGSASVLGSRRTATPLVAAFLNGFCGHALDFDDTYDEVGHHATAQCLPAALAVAQDRGASGKDLIAAIAWGQDIGTRLSAARGAAAREDPQWFPITTFGPFAAAASAGKVMGLRHDQFVNLFGLALHRCHGQMSAVTARQSEIRAFRDGFVAQDGVMVATTAYLDIQACRDGIEQLYSNYYDDDYDPDVILTGLGEQFWGEQAAIKPWPCCRATHGYVDGIRSLVDEHGITPDAIDGIILDARQFTLSNLGEPVAEKRRPTKSIQAKFSLHFAAALAAVREPKIADFIGDALQDPLVLSLADKVETRLDNNCGKLLPTNVEIRLRDGRVLSRRCDDILGSATRALSDDALLAKFRDCLSYAREPLRSQDEDRLIDMLLNLEKVRNVAELTDLLP